MLEGAVECSIQDVPARAKGELVSLDVLARDIFTTVQLEAQQTGQPLLSAETLLEHLDNGALAVFEMNSREIRALKRRVRVARNGRAPTLSPFTPVAFSHSNDVLRRAFLSMQTSGGTASRSGLQMAEWVEFLNMMADIISMNNLGDGDAARPVEGNQPH